jgi:hypothetical protein
MPTPNSAVAEQRGSERFRSLAVVARDLGAEDIAREASDLETRPGEGRFFVACVGQFKRGKSTLLNALVGQPILPTGVVPVATALTAVRYGPTLGTRVRFSDGRETDVDPVQIRDYVSETHNPANQKGVAVVEVTRVTAWAEDVEPQAGAMYAATMACFVEIAYDFVRRLSPATSGSLAIDLEEIGSERGFREPARFFFTSLLTLTDPGLGTCLLDWLRSHRSRIASLTRHPSRYLDGSWHPTAPGWETTSALASPRASVASSSRFDSICPRWSRAPSAR